MVRMGHVRTCVTEVTLESIIGRDCGIWNVEITVRPRKVPVEYAKLLEILQPLLVAKTP